MATRQVVHDDQDTQAIEYVGMWFQETGAFEDLGNFGPPYLHTLHGTNQSSASVFFDFNGTSLEVYGTSIPNDPLSNPDPNFECFIDGVSIGRTELFKFPENCWKLCEKGGLTASPHRLQISITVQSPEQTFWLDQIIYTPSPDVPLDNKMIKLTSTDSAIRLDSSWELVAESKATKKKNAVAHVDFIGTSASWVGFIPTEFPHGSAFGTYSIDGGQPVDFKLAGLPGNGVTTLFNQTFFTALGAENGPHTLDVTFLGSEDTTPLTLSCLYVQNGTSLDSPSNTTRIPSTSSVSSITSISNITSSPSTTNSPSTTSSPSTTTSSPSATAATNSDSANGGSQLNIAGIVGGILGGLMLVILITGVFLYLRHRRSSGKNVVKPFGGGFFVPVPNNSYGAFPTNVGIQGAPIADTTAQETYKRRSVKRREALGIQPMDSSHGRSEKLGLSSRERAVPSASGKSSGPVHTDHGVQLNQPLDEGVHPQYILE